MKDNPSLNESLILSLVMLVSLVNSNTAIAQDNDLVVPPRVDIMSDKPAYRLFEPVVLTVRVTNVSSQPQTYYALSAVSPFLRIRITDPSGKIVPMYQLPAHPVYGFGVDIETSPGESVSDSMLVSNFYPLTASEGSYEVEIGVNMPQVPGSADRNPGRLSFRVVSPGSPELVSDVIQPYGRAVSVVRGLRDLVDRQVLEALEGVVSLPDPAASYLVEPATYYLAEANRRLADFNDFLLPHQQKIDVGSRTPLEDAIRGFEVLLARYPESTFVPLARSGLAAAQRSMRARNNRPPR